jgi:hypothetical protein
MCQTSVTHIYSAGDAIGFPSLASTSMEQGGIAACHAFKIAMPSAPDYFPYGIYAVPELDFPHFSSAWPSGHSPKDILVSDEAQGVIDRQDGAAERACRSRSVLPERPIEYLESSDPVGRKRVSNAPGWVR